MIDLLQIQYNTRMVQLRATAAIEYVTACWVSGAGDFCPGVLLPGRLFPRGTFGREDFCPGGIFPGGLLSGRLMSFPPKFNAYTHRLGFLCLAS